MKAVAGMLCLGMALGACAGRHPKPTPNTTVQAPATPAPLTAPFEAALEAINGGEIDRILALRGESDDGKMGEFLRQLYVRYGDVESLVPLAVEKAGPVSRGVFLAEHQYGPFVWDIITDGVTYPLLRASNDLTPYLQPTKAPEAAAATVNTAIDRLNEGKSQAVFPLIVCRCMTEQEFSKQVDVLARRGGSEVNRRLVRTESIPGLENRLLIMHYLSERGDVRLGFHFTLWKVKDQWRINAVNWTQEELLPPPLANARTPSEKRDNVALNPPVAP